MRSSVPRSPGSKTIAVFRGVANARADLRELSGDHFPQAHRIAENRFKSSNRLSELRHLFIELGPAEPGEPAEGHVEM
jgi:uncharacterized protein YhbP (UPF0306 family)